MQGYKFTLTAASYTSPAGSFERPCCIELPEGDPRISIFRNNPSFKEGPVTLPDPVKAKVADSEPELPDPGGAKDKKSKEKESK